MSTEGMSAAGIDKLAARRNLFIMLAKVLLIGTSLLWLCMMVFYDPSADGAARPSILLTSRTSFLLWSEHIQRIDERRIWGGPSTLFGLWSLIGSLATISIIAFLRAWLNRGALSRIGVGFGLVALVLGIACAGAETGAVYPATLTPANFERLTAAIEARQPGLIARLKAGEHPTLPASGGGTRRLTVSSGNQVAVIEDLEQDGPELRDRDDVEGLRFALAGQAYARGDLPTLRRLLPIALAMPPTDLPARNDFARRLVAMGAAAGMAPVPAADRAVVMARATYWNAVLTWIGRARVLLQIMLWSGLSCLVIGLILRWSHGRIEAQRAKLEALQAPSRRNRTAAGVTAP